MKHSRTKIVVEQDSYGPKLAKETLDPSAVWEPGGDDDPGTLPDSMPDNDISFERSLARLIGSDWLLPVINIPGAM